MKRSEFLKIIGAGSLIGVVGLPSAQAVDDLMKERSGIKPKEDPFAVIRKLMKEAAKPDWEYHFSIRRGNWGRQEYTVHLFQNDNYHRETWVDVSDIMFKEGGVIDGFSERAQRDVFHRLMCGVNKFNALPQEKRLEIKQFMSQYGKV